MTTFAVIGAGAIGSAVAARLTGAGHDVRLLARGARADLLERDGIRLSSPEGRIVARPQIIRSAQESPCDVLFLATKADALPGLVPTIARMAGADTLIVPLCNGVPWWYFHGETHERKPMAAVDPEELLFRNVDPAGIVGAVVLLRCTLDEDGGVSSQGAERLVLGEIMAGQNRDRIDDLAQVLAAAGFLAARSDDIRADIWAKVALNLATNPLSVVTGATLHEMFHDPQLAVVVSAIITETLGLAGAYGRRPAVSLEALMNIGKAAGPFMTSMAQDHANARPLELGAIAEAPFELAASAGVPMPVAQAIARLAMHKVTPAPCRTDAQTR